MCRLDGHVGAAIGELVDSADDVVGVLSVDHLGGSQFRCQLQDLGVDVHRDHFGPNRRGNYHGRQTDSAAAVDRHPLTGRHPALCHDGPERGGESAPEAGRSYEVHVVRQTHEIDFGVVDRHQLGKRPPVSESGLGLVVANLVIPARALRARTAAADEWHGHPIAPLPCGHLAAGFLNGAGQLVPRYVRQPADVGVMPQPTMPIAAADSTRLDLDDDAARIGSGIIHLCDLERPAKLLEYNRLHQTHPIPPSGRRSS
jgi:hypothetical protein